MQLDKDTNYIVSGLERSGTSMLMQILKSGGIPIGFDESRPPDKSNPRGYYELEGGKIINKLMDGTFSIFDYKGKFIKVTSFGLKYLPPGKYKIIYSERNIEEILDSMEKMIGKEDENRDVTRQSFIKLNSLIKRQIIQRDDIDVLFISYNQTITKPKDNVKKIVKFLGLDEKVMEKMINAVDQKLYRQRKPEIKIDKAKNIL